MCTASAFAAGNPPFFGTAAWPRVAEEGPGEAATAIAGGELLAGDAAACTPHSVHVRLVADSGSASSTPEARFRLVVTMPATAAACCNGDRSLKRK
jgi:hypothetical protein